MRILGILTLLFVVCKNSLGCQDIVYNCKDYKNKGWCYASHKNNNYMKNMCPKICGFCGFSTVQPQATTQTPTTGTCGLPEVSNGRVVSGSESKPGQWPWQIAMYVDGHFSCGGSILTPLWIITAAHCLSELNPTNNIKIVAGDFDRSNLNGEEQSVEIERSYIHPHYYTPIEHSNDLALIKLKIPLRLGRYIKTVCIPKIGEEVPDGTKCYVTGWGRTHYKGETVMRMRQATLNIINQTECIQRNRRILPTQLCGYNNIIKEQSACQGDSGGPLVCQEANGNWKLHGVVSWGSSKCLSKFRYTVFSRMSKFRYWIDETMGLINKPTITPPPRGDCKADPPSNAALLYNYVSNNQETCGLPTLFTGRVIGGEFSRPGQWPWQIALYKTTYNSLKNDYVTRFQCGGSLIAPNWVLTAAHCIWRSTSRKFNVTVGDINRNDTTGSEQTVGVERLIPNLNYKRPSSQNNDIALLKLSRPVILGKFVNTICLPPQGNDVPVGSKCFISGWGKTDYYEGVVPKLHHARLNIISHKECFRKKWRINPVTRQMVCAGNGHLCQQTGCHGDSGGPLVCQGANGKWILHGAVSWGSPYCDTTEASTVFSRISEFRDWIDEMMKKYS